MPLGEELEKLRNCEFSPIFPIHQALNILKANATHIKTILKTFLVLVCK